MASRLIPTTPATSSTRRPVRPSTCPPPGYPPSFRRCPTCKAANRTRVTSPAPQDGGRAVARPLLSTPAAPTRRRVSPTRTARRAAAPPGRDGAYQGSLLLGGGGREQYGNALVRSVNGSYSSPYPAYVTPEIPPSWTAGHFESSVLHSLQTRQAALPGRRSTFGKVAVAPHRRLGARARFPALGAGS